MATFTLVRLLVGGQESGLATEVPAISGPRTSVGTRADGLAELGLPSPVPLRDEGSEVQPNSKFIERKDPIGGARAMNHLSDLLLGET
jgi:hypothetical protein